MTSIEMKQKAVDMEQRLREIRNLLVEMGCLTEEEKTEFSLMARKADDLRKFFDLNIDRAFSKNLDLEKEYYDKMKGE